MYIWKFQWDKIQKYKNFNRRNNSKDIIVHNDYNKSVDVLLGELRKYEKLLQNKKDYIKAKWSLK